MNQYKPSDDFINNLVSLFEDARDSFFMIGDLLVREVDRNAGVPKAKIFNSLAGSLSMSPKTLYAYESTSRRWTPDKRLEYQNLDWYFYKETDPNDQDDIALLERAIDEFKNTSWLMSQKYGGKKPPSLYIEKSIAQIESFIDLFLNGDDGIPNDVFIEVDRALEALNIAKEKLNML